MAKQTKRIPIHGSMTRPGGRAEGAVELKKGRLKWEFNSPTIEFESEEFKCNCPSTGQPDYYKLHVSYIPQQYYLESKTIKFYLWSYDAEGYHCEKLAVQIAQDIKEALSSDLVGIVTVKLQQKPRGGIGITTTYTE